MDRGPLRLFVQAPYDPEAFCGRGGEMKYLHEFRDGAVARRYASALERRMTRPWVLMEVCGGQTHAILKFGVDALLPAGLTLVHGPGCPVCVTACGVIEKALEIAARPEVIFCTFGDMMRVPGASRDLFAVKAGGGDVRMVYSPLDAVRLAQAHPQRQVVFFAVGFETTAPANGMAVYQARRLGLSNFSILCAQVLVPPALGALLDAPDNRVQAFLAPGHVCAVSGFEEYEALGQRYRVPLVVTGFEPLDLLQGLLMAVTQLEEGRCAVENAYSRAVVRLGNPHARRLLAEVFEVVDREWRGLGLIPRSGLGLQPAYRAFDAEERFGPARREVGGAVRGACLSGLVLRGVRKPWECPAFGTDCTPERPLGATMVSSEGACAAYFRYGSARR